MMKLQNDEKKLKRTQEGKEKFSKIFVSGLKWTEIVFPSCSLTALIYYCIGENKEVTLSCPQRISLSDLLCCPCLFCGVRREEMLLSTCPLSYRLRFICPSRNWLHQRKCAQSNGLCHSSVKSFAL